MKLFNKFGIDYDTAGQNLGKAFARGLEESMADVVRVLRRLGAVIEDYLKTKSPTRKGPLSTLNTWWDGFVPALTSGVERDMSSAMRDIAGAAYASPGLGNATVPIGGASFPLTGQNGRAPMIVHLNVYNPLLLERDAAPLLAEQVAPHLARITGYTY